MDLCPGRIIAPLYNYNNINESVFRQLDSFFSFWTSLFLTTETRKSICHIHRHES
jgi:hypothetical protein